jgi:hypothetical protein
MSKSALRFVALAGCMVLAVTLVGLGCQDDGSSTGSRAAAVECADDGSCPGAAPCVRGWCMPECTADADCPAGICVSGVCEFEPEPWACAADTDCPAGTSCAAGFCVADPATCTPAAEVCNGIDDDCDGAIDEGVCTCDPGWVMCGGVCVDVLFDALNCGACDLACAAGQTCERGICIAGVPCTTDRDCDDGDPATVDWCVAGACTHDATCVPTVEICNGLDDDCDGVVDNGVHCDPTCTSDADCDDGDPATTDLCVAGYCTHGTTCVPAVEICNGIDDDCDGVVDEGCPCPAGETMCGGACVDLLFDDLNCGACGAACAAGQTCLRGVCTA